MTANTKPIYSSSFSIAGDYIISYSRLSTIRIWSLEQKNCSRSIEGISTWHVQPRIDNNQAMIISRHHSHNNVCEVYQQDILSDEIIPVMSNIIPITMFDVNQKGIMCYQDMDQTKIRINFFDLHTKTHIFYSPEIPIQSFIAAIWWIDNDTLCIVNDKPIICSILYQQDSVGNSIIDCHLNHTLSFPIAVSSALVDYTH